MSNRPLIALLTNDLVGTYQYELWSGMKSTASTDDCDLVSFNCGALGSADNNKRMRNSCFDLVRSAKPDAVVVLASIFTDISIHSEVDSVLASLKPAKVVTVGFQAPGYPSIQVDNQVGMEALVDHLVEVHGRRKFCFLEGTKSSWDSIERRQAVERALARHGLSLRPEAVLEARYDFGIARDLVRDFVDTGIPCDAIVAANDNMALGAMEALRERARRIPDDVIVTGFDNVEDGLWVPPSLTTVEQPMQEQGASAVRMALSLIDGEKVDDNVRMASYPIFRGSCGCLGPSLASARRTCCEAAREIEPGGQFAGERHLEEIFARCDQALTHPRYRPYVKDLVEALWSDANKEEEGDCSSSLRFELLFEVAMAPGEDYHRWQVFLSDLRVASLPFLPDSRRICTQFESLIHLLRVKVHERSVQQIGLTNLQTQRWAREVHEVGNRLTDCREVWQVVDILASEAKNLKIASLNLLLHESGARRDHYRLHLAIRGGVREALPTEGLATGAGEAFRRILGKNTLRTAIVVEPLFFSEIQLGFAFFELVSRRGMLLDSLRGLISASLVGTRLGEELSEWPFFGGASSSDGSVGARA